MGNRELQKVKAVKEDGGERLYSPEMGKWRSSGSIRGWREILDSKLGTELLSIRSSQLPREGQGHPMLRELYFGRRRDDA